MSTTIDDLSAVRIIYDALIQLDEPTRERVLRWVIEKLGTSSGTAHVSSSSHSGSAPNKQKRPVGRPKTVSGSQVEQYVTAKLTQESNLVGNDGLSEFLAHVQPKTANQIIAATARFFQQAPAAVKRPNIDSSDVEAAYTVMKKNVPTYIGQLLITAKNAGYVRNVERGKYALTVLGEEMLSEASAGRSEISSTINQ